MGQASGGHKVGKFVHLPGGAGHLPFLSHLMSECPKRICRGDEEKKSSTATKHPVCMMRPESKMVEEFEDLSLDSDYSSDEEQNAKKGSPSANEFYDDPIDLLKRNQECPSTVADW